MPGKDAPLYYRPKTPNYPSAPNTTPASGTHSHATKTRAPIHNPYEKFTAPQFDDWISGITGSLRDALGYHDETSDQPVPPTSTSPDYNAYEEVANEGDTVDEIANEDHEDSFAELKARRKGKERDPIDGPGLGPGTIDAPIDLSSDSEDEEDDDEGEDEEEKDESEESLSPPQVQTREDDLFGSDASDDEVIELIDSDAETEDEEEEKGVGLIAKTAPPRSNEVVDPLSDIPEETEPDSEGPVQYSGIEDAEDDYVDEPTLQALKSSPPAAMHYVGSDEEDQESGSSSGYSDEDDTGTHMLLGHPNGVEKAPKHLEIDDQAEQDDLFGSSNESQPITGDTVFPPRHSSYFEPPVSIADPWEGPQMYAEDFYAGGEISSQAEPSDPHVMGSEVLPSIPTPVFITPAEAPLPTPPEAIAIDPDLMEVGQSVESSSGPVADFEGTYEDFASDIQQRTNEESHDTSSSRPPEVTERDVEKDGESGDIEPERVSLEASMYDAHLPEVTEKDVEKGVGNGGIEPEGDSLEASMYDARKGSDDAVEDEDVSNVIMIDGSKELAQDDIPSAGSPCTDKDGDREAVSPSKDTLQDIENTNVERDVVQSPSLPQDRDISVIAQAAEEEDHAEPDSLSFQDPAPIIHSTPPHLAFSFPAITLYTSESPDKPGSFLMDGLYPPLESSVLERTASENEEGLSSASDSLKVGEQGGMQDITVDGLNQNDVSMQDLTSEYQPLPSPGVEQPDNAKFSGIQDDVVELPDLEVTGTQPYDVESVNSEIVDDIVDVDSVIEVDGQSGERLEGEVHEVGTESSFSRAQSLVVTTVASEDLAGDRSLETESHMIQVQISSDTVEPEKAASPTPPKGDEAISEGPNHLDLELTYPNSSLGSHDDGSPAVAVVGLSDAQPAVLAEAIVQPEFARDESHLEEQPSSQLAMAEDLFPDMFDPSKPFSPGGDLFSMLLGNEVLVQANAPDPIIEVTSSTGAVQDATTETHAHIDVEKKEPQESERTTSPTLDSVAHDPVPEQTTMTDDEPQPSRESVDGKMSRASFPGIDPTLVPELLIPYHYNHTTGKSHSIKLQADPYPASLSTPGTALDDMTEGEDSSSSASTADDDEADDDLEDDSHSIHPEMSPDKPETISPEEEPTQVSTSTDVAILPKTSKEELDVEPVILKVPTNIDLPTQESEQTLMDPTSSSQSTQVVPDTEAAESKGDGQMHERHDSKPQVPLNVVASVPVDSTRTSENQNADLQDFSVVDANSKQDGEALEKSVGRPSAPQTSGTSPSSVDVSPSKRRSQSVDKEQYDALMEVYRRTSSPATSECAELSERLNMTPQTVQTWFHNQRQNRPVSALQPTNGQMDTATYQNLDKTKSPKAKPSSADPEEPPKPKSASPSSSADGQRRSNKRKRDTANLPLPEPAKEVTVKSEPKGPQGPSPARSSSPAREVSPAKSTSAKPARRPLAVKIPGKNATLSNIDDGGNSSVIVIPSKNSQSTPAASPLASPFKKTPSPVKPLLPDWLVHQHGARNKMNGGVMAPPAFALQPVRRTQTLPHIPKTPSTEASGTPRDSPRRSPGLSSQASPDTHRLRQTASMNAVKPSRPLTTRSRCRYHKISIPEEEGSGQRSYFLVPGCSLGDQEVIEEEEILDHGLATQEDIAKMVMNVDLEMLKIHPNVVGVLRHLCGIDLIRHQEIYYLLKRGETLQTIVKNPKKLDQRTRHRVSMSKDSLDRPPFSARAVSPSNISISARSSGGPSSVKPPSVAESTSTSRSVARKLMNMDRATPSTTSTSDNDEADGESHSSKRRRTSRAPSEAPGIAAKSTGRRKSRRLAKEAAEYQPPRSDEEGADSDGEGDKPRTTRGVKRARTSDVGVKGEGEASRHKRLRTHTTMPSTQS